MNLTQIEAPPPVEFWIYSRFCKLFLFSFDTESEKAILIKGGKEVYVKFELPTL